LSTQLAVEAIVDSIKTEGWLCLGQHNFVSIVDITIKLSTAT